MTKKNKEKDKDDKWNAKRIAELLKSAARTVQTVGSALAQSHPIVIGLTIMTGCTIGELMQGPRPQQGSTYEWDWTNQKLKGLYDGAQAIAVGSAVVPVISGGLNLLGSALATYEARK